MHGMKKLTLSLLFVLFCTTSVEASLGSSCGSFLSKLVSLIGIETYSPPEFSNETRAAFLELKSLEYTKTQSVSFRDGYYREGQYLLSIMPEKVIDYLAQYPTSRDNIISFKRKINTEFGFEMNSIMDNVFSIISSLKKRNPENLKQEINSVIERYENLPLVEKKAIEEKFQYQQSFYEARSSWHSYGKIKLNIVEGIREIQIEINGYVLKGKRSQRKGHPVVELTVPVELVKHPAWNPLNHEYIAKLAADPFRRQKMEYDVDLGHDGYFYLMDGNHRFTLYSNPTVKVVLSDPITTESLRVFFDLQNITQPNHEQIMSIHRGELNPYDLIPHHIRRNILFEN